MDDLFPPRSDGLCRMCQKKLTGKQRNWCSRECGNEAFDDLMFAKGSSTQIRARVFERDNGICALCGIDAEKIQRISNFAKWSLITHSDRVNPFERGYEFVDNKFRNFHEEFEKSYLKSARVVWANTALNFGGSCWQADHITEVFHGGKHEMENLQTLCNLCHKNKTRRMSRRVKIENQSTLF